MITTELAADPAISRCGLDSDTLLEMYRRLLLSRALDLRACRSAARDGPTSSSQDRGHEAAEIGSAFALERGDDWVSPTTIAASRSSSESV